MIVESYLTELYELTQFFGIKLKAVYLYVDLPESTSVLPL